MTETGSTREVNMDLERVLLIFMVIVLHYNNRGMGGALNYGAVGGAKEIFLRLTQSLSICAVDAFLMLSGYFYRSRETIPWKKALWLLATCSFYRVVGYVLYVIFVTGDFSVRTLIAYLIPSNWFVCLFVTVLLLSPFLGRLLDGLDGDGLKKFTCVCAGLFVLVPTFTELAGDIAGVDLNGLSTITLNGDIDGFTAVSFTTCFIIGYYLKRNREKLAEISGWVWLGIYLAGAVVSMFISFVSERVWSYSDIFTVLCAAALTMAFTKVRIREGAAVRVISAVGECGLGIFVWHTMPLMIYGYWVHMGIDRISDGSLGFYVGNLLLSVLSMYGLSFVWVYTCRRVTGYISLRRKKNEA